MDSTTKNFLIASFTLFSAVLTGCFGQKGASSTTGWGYNDRKNGGFTVNSIYQEQKNPPGMVLIEGGSFVMGHAQDDFMRDWNNTPTVQHVRSFYMDETEITNTSYLEYLYWLKRVFPPSEAQYVLIYKSALPDTLVWRNPLGANESLVINYLRHPAYRDYPVVGVSWLQASKYCDWRTDRVNENILIQMGIMNQTNGSQNKIVEGANHFDTETYLTNPDAVFQDKSGDAYRKGLPDNNPTQENKGTFKGRHANMEDGILFPRYRLPSESEWEYAAIGKNKEGDNVAIIGKSRYPWGSKYPIVTDPKERRNKGKYLANYKISKGDYAGISGQRTDGADITNRVKAYPPNDYGLYDMAGNVAEWVADVYRPIIDQDKNDFNYYRGNVYQKNTYGADGNPNKVVAESMEFDTLSDGRLYPKQIPGELAKAKITDEDTYMRFNYNRADNINFDDGDAISSKNFADPESNQMGSDYVYNSPQNTIHINENGEVISEYDSTSRTSLINDKVRVYKGGSWKDRLYWLDPAQRRYLQQDLSSDFIGFRCAMDRVGDLLSKKTKVSRPTRWFGEIPLEPTNRW